MSDDVVVFDLTSSPTVDFGVAQLLEALQRKLESCGTDLRVAGADAEVMNLFEATGLAANVGGVTPEGRSTTSSTAGERSDRPNEWNRDSHRYRGGQHGLPAYW
ncbi:STAS domain-containing protein [Natrinema sp. 74]|uniref:STAS domain-containing protein n=1 Tax=Natrinema sp. 74 TaxID=3384159 RepID=UPI0038D4E341